MSSSQQPDLIRRVAAGEAGALNTLYRRHSAGIRALCLRMTGSADAADDLTQEVFLRAVRAAEGFRGEAAAETWLHSIARNLCLDHLRAKSRRSIRESEAASEAGLLGPGPSGARLEAPFDESMRAGWRPGESVEAERRLEVLDEALGRLSPEDREVIVLARFLGMGSGRMGEILECSPGAARVRLHRALVRLRRECVRIAEEEEES